ncbi:ABC transporter permease [Brevibacterium otitidis]|uniref:ABC transporter permease n=1 Tax=Brevibacterium otitidis TaxID=53364 RepID=A0ABV5X2P9_9MICO|nr:ABC transporter permease [Brevibacterium otitidis]
MSKVDRTPASGAAPSAQPAPASGVAAGTGAAPAGSRVLAQTGFEIAAILRNGEQLLVSIILPAIILIGLATTPILSALGADLGGRPAVDVATAGVLSLALGSSAFTGQAIATAFDRRYGVLRQLATTPLGVRGLIAGKFIAVAAVVVIQYALIGILAWILGASGGVHILSLALTAGLGTAMFLVWGLVMAGTIRAEATLALANLLWVLMAAAGGLLLAPPGMWGAIVSWLPSGALGEAMRTAVLSGGIDPLALAVMAGWTLMGIVTGVRFFSFDAR